MSDQARKGDPTICPKHTRGKITNIAREDNCETNNLEVACVGDYATCTTGDIDVIVEGARTVTIGSRYAARVGTKLWHGGSVEKGSPNVDIGGPTITSDEIIKEAKDRASQVLKCAEKRLSRWNKDDQAMFKQYFGSDSNAARKVIQKRVAANKDVMDKAKFKFGPKDTNSKHGNNPDTFAHVYASDSAHNVYLDPAFWPAPTEGTDNQTGTLLHEMSHFKDVGGTADHIYSRDNAIALATKDPAKALNNADNYEYFMENVQETCK